MNRRGNSLNSAGRIGVIVTKRQFLTELWRAMWIVVRAFAARFGFSIEKVVEKK